MTTEQDRVPAPLGADARALAAELPLTADEASYAEAAGAPNTLRGYRSDWSEFTAWCTRLRLERVSQFFYVIQLSPVLVREVLAPDLRDNHIPRAVTEESR